MTSFQDLTPEMLTQVRELWAEVSPSKPATEAIIRERIFGPPDYSPKHAPCVVDENGMLKAFAVIVPPGGEPPKDVYGPAGGIRWFAVHPSCAMEKEGAALLAECEARLKGLGAGGVDFLCTPPYYIQPGVDTRFTDMIAWLTRHGYEHRRTIFNMTVDLGALAMPAAEHIFHPDPAGYLVRRGREEDREEFSSFCRSEWGEGWKTEGCLGLGHAPSSLFLAIRKAPSGDPPEEIVGFAVYEANQLMGCFGPTGVAEEHQGRGLGRRLLFATLADMKALGRTTCEIGWVGPVDFYWRACGAHLGPSFWAMRKIFKS